MGDCLHVACLHYCFICVEDLFSRDTNNSDKKSINDIPVLLAANSKKTFSVGPPSDSKYAQEVYECVNLLIDSLL